MARLRPGTADASAPSDCSFFSNAGVALPEASRPTLTGMSFCDTDLSAAWVATCVTCAASRRGEAKEASCDCAEASPCSFNCSNITAAKASPSFFRALGGSSSTKSSTSRFCVVIALRRFLLQVRHPLARRHRETQAFAAVVITLGDAARQVADAADVRRAFSDADRAARIQQVEAVRGLEHLLVSRQRELLLHQVPGLPLVRRESREEEVRIAVLEVVGRLLFLVLQVDVAVAQAFGPGEVIDVVDLLQVHGQALQPVGDLAGDRLAIDAANLLEIGE